MLKQIRNPDGGLNVQVVVALIGAAATLTAAIIAGAFGVLQLQLRSAGDQPPAPTSLPTPTAQAVPSLVVEIDGPTEAPLGKSTYFTIISEDAARAEWTIAGFGGDEIDPFNRSEQIFVEPGDAGRVGEYFTLVVTVYDDDGNDAGARHRFQVTDGEQ